MKPDVKTYALHLKTEIRNAKKSLVSIQNPRTVASYIQELIALETELSSFFPIYSDRQQSADNIEIFSSTLSASSLENLSNSLSPPLIDNIPIDVPNRPFTLEELSYYTGQDGYPAYVALNGIVFNMTDIPTWGAGTHFGMVAGTDVTARANACGYHDLSYIMRILPTVGYLVPSSEGLTGPPGPPSTSETGPTESILNPFIGGTQIPGSLPPSVGVPDILLPNIPGPIVFPIPSAIPFIPVIPIPPPSN
jgi:predicted heme/steroid binding protein